MARKRLIGKGKTRLVKQKHCDKCNKRFLVTQLCRQHKQQRAKLLNGARQTNSQKDWNKLLVFDGLAADRGRAR